MSTGEIMIRTEQIPTLLGRKVYDTEHKKVGTAEHVYLDTMTGQPGWLTVRTGLFGTKETFVPMDQLQVRDDEVQVPFTKDQIKNAPNLDVEGDQLDAGQEEVVYDYYGMAYSPAAGTGQARRGASDEAMTRSEERCGSARKRPRPDASGSASTSRLRSSSRLFRYARSRYASSANPSPMRTATRR
jgi:sporulation protein YlmC with PRC-barrel domain